MLIHLDTKATNILTKNKHSSLYPHPKAASYMALIVLELTARPGWPRAQ